MSAYGSTCVNAANVTPSLAVLQLDTLEQALASPDVEWQDIKAMFLTLKMSLPKNMASIVDTVANASNGRNTYCDTSNAQCTGPTCRCCRIRCPTWDGCVCRECGRGQQYGWGMRCMYAVCDERPPNTPDQGCFMFWLTFVGAGYLCYLWQCLASPVCGWNCRDAECATETCTCSCCSCTPCACGCPLRHRPGNLVLARSIITALRRSPLTEQPPPHYCPPRPTAPPPPHEDMLA